MKLKIAKNKIILIIAIIAIAGFSIYYAAAGIFKTNTQVVNDLTSGLVGYWTFDGQDASWSENTATLANKGSAAGSNCASSGMSQKSTPVAGKIGQAFSFDGSDDFLNCGNSVFSFGKDNSMTLSFWFYPKDKGVDYQLFSKFAGTTPYGMDLKFRPSAKRFILEYIYDDTVSNWFRADLLSAVSSFNDWYYVTITYDGSGNANGINYYINGSLGSKTVIFNTLTSDTANSADFKIGRDFFGNYALANMDEVRLYSRVLSAGEIAELYSQSEKRLAKINTQAKDTLNEGLVGRWTLDGQDINWGTGIVSDASGNNYQGIVRGNVSTSSPRTGIMGQALYFNASGDFIDMGDINALDGQSYFSASAWVNVQKPLRPYGTIFNKRQDQNNSIGLSLDNDLHPWAVSPSISNGAENYILTDSLSMSNYTESWHHWLMVFDGTQTGNANRLKFYFDGIQQSLDFTNATVPATTPSNSASFQIGYSSMAPRSYIDEVRVYNRALSASEAVELYNQGAKRMLKINAPRTDIIPGGLVGYWTFDGQDTNWATGITNDKSGNGYSGQTYNMSTSTSPAVGVVGQAMYFDGVNDYIDLGNQAAFNWGTGDFAISFWYKVPGYKEQCFLGKDDYSVGLNPGFMIYGGQGATYGASALFYFDSTDRWTKTYYAADTSWHHYVVTRLSGQLTSYNDSVPYGTWWADSVNSSNSRSLIIGADSPPNEAFFKGYMDELRIYNRALSASEAMELYRAGSSR